MASSGSFLVAVIIALLVVSMLHSVSDAKSSSKKRFKGDPSHLRTSRSLNFVPAVRLSESSESRCFKPDMRYDMYVAIPPKLFKNGRACNKTLRVSCAEPYRDLGGPWQVCKSSLIFTVTVIDQVQFDPLGDDLFQLSGKAFWRMAAAPDMTDSIRLIIHQ